MPSTIFVSSKRLKDLLHSLSEYKYFSFANAKGGQNIRNLYLQKSKNQLLKPFYQIITTHVLVALANLLALSSIVFVLVYGISFAPMESVPAKMNYRSTPYPFSFASTDDAVVWHVKEG